MKKSLWYLGTLSMVLVLFASCEKDDEDKKAGQYENGALVLNEGAFGNSNASVSFIDLNKKEITNEVFYLENDRSLGDVLQSATSDKNNVYFVLNGSSKVEVVDKRDFSSVTTIDGFSSPRCITSYNGNLYVSQWSYPGEVKIVNASTQTVSGTVTVGNGPEGILASNNMIWVANGGGFGLDSTISVIDPSNNSVSQTIIVGDNPKELVEDKNGDVWALCYGHIEYDTSWAIVGQTASKLVKISGSDYSVEAEIEISETSHPSHLDISPDGQTLYYGGGFGYAGIYAIEITATTAPSSTLIDGYYYGFNVNPENGDVYCCSAPDFTSAGSVKVYNASGVVQKKYDVGIGPNGVIF